MAQVQAQVIGGAIVQRTAATVGELKQQMGVPNHQGSVNGRPVDDNYSLRDYEFVSFSEKVKGADETATK